MSAELNSADSEEARVDNQADAESSAPDTTDPAAADVAVEAAVEAAAEVPADPGVTEDVAAAGGSAGDGTVEVTADAADEPAATEDGAAVGDSEGRGAAEADGDSAVTEESAPLEAATESKPAKPGKTSKATAQIEKIRAAMQSGSSVQGKVIGWNDGGLHVAVGDATAFCPHSEMELGDPLEPKQYVDHTYDFFVLRIEKDKRIVLSRVSHLRQEQKAQQEVTRNQIAVGAVLTGKVVSIKDFGAFVDLGGVQGLVHISELARRRVEKTEDVVKPGDDVQVKVLKLDKGGRRISLSMRALEPDPWKGVASRFPVGSKVQGRVEKVERFGAFVELEPGLSGLLPSSKMSIPAGTSASRVFRPGREVTVQILSVDSRRQRISLGLEGDGAEGSRSDFEAYLNESTASAGGFNALADALSKFKS
jgi:small subunit ribosomal protein S1